MPRPDLEKHQGQFAATRFYRCDDPTSLLSFIRRGADAADHHFIDGALPELFYCPGLGARAGAHHRHGAGARQAHGERRPARHGPGRGPRFRALPLCAQPGAMEQSRRRPHAADDDPRQVSAHRAGGDRDRRHDRTPLGPQDRRSWRLSRPSAFLAWSFRQDERLALALGDGHGSRSMDAATLGLALPDYSGALRTLQHRPVTKS